MPQRTGRKTRRPAAELDEYRAKRDFSRTEEPAGAAVASTGPLQFVVQKHDASQLHFDLRLEIDGVMKSWAVPKGPSLDPTVKRLAMQVEDHPVEYNTFEGTIPAEEYGGGTVMLWDRGTYTADPSTVGAGGAAAAVREGYGRGDLKFELHGERLRGSWVLVRTRLGPGGSSSKPSWLLIKHRDSYAKPGSDIVASELTSVTTGRTMEEIAAPRGAPPLPGLSFEITHPDKVYFPAQGYTKGDLARYYAAVAPQILPAIAARPLALKRYPNGIDAPFFFQQKAPAAKDTPRGVRVATVPVALDGESHRRLIGGALATLLYTVQLGCIGVDPWNARLPTLDTPDYLVIDLDPGPDVPFARVVEVAQRVGAVLDALDLHGLPKTSGSRGIHVYVPLPLRTKSDVALAVAQRIATQVAREYPGLATVQRELARRPPGTVYVDYLQNSRGKTVAAPYAVRAVDGARVSMPLRWDELIPALDPRDFTIVTAPARAAALGDWWAASMARRNPAAAVRAAAEPITPEPQPPAATVGRGRR